MRPTPHTQAPRVVVLASYALGTMAILAALDTIAAVLTIGHLDGAESAFTRTMTAEHSEGAEIASQVLANVRAALDYNVTIAGTAVVVFGVLSTVVRRRSRVVRPAVWVAGALAAYAFGCGIGANPEDTIPPGDWQTTLAQAWSTLLPPWYSVARSLLTVGELLAVLGSALLLMRTPASDYYRRQYAEPGLGSYLVERQRKLDTIE